MRGRRAGPVVGLVHSEPISDLLIEKALAREGLRCVSLRPESGRAETLRAILGCEVLLKSFGAYSSGYFRLFALARALRRKVVVYWIGSDVLHAAGAKAAWTRRIQRLVTSNLTVTEGLAAELAAIAIRAEVLPIVSELGPIQPASLPRPFAVLTYLPDHDHAFYGSETVSALVSRLPHVQFLIVGGWKYQASPSNVDCLGFVTDMARVYRRASVLLRLTPHDGLPKMVLEALAYGRGVIWSHPFPHCRVARTLAEVETALASLADDPPNLAGAAFVRERFSFATFATSLATHMRGLTLA